MNNVVPSFIAQDAGASERFQAQLKRNEEAVAAIREEMLPGEEDWVPEDETPDAQLQDELGTGNLPTTLWRIVNERGEVERSHHSTALNKPYYATLKGAKSAAAYARNRLSRKVRIQKGTVTWEEL